MGWLFTVAGEVHEVVEIECHIATDTSTELCLIMISKATCITIYLDTWGHVSKIDFVNKDISLICLAMIN